jgi:hypothetical protein
MPFLSIRHRLIAGLAAAGFCAGAVFGVAITVFGKIIGDAPPATIANYGWNATIFGVAAAVVSPFVTWSALRRVPLWRTVVEPLALAVAGGALGVVAASPAAFLILPAVGLLFGFARLSRAYRLDSAKQIVSPPQ